MQRNKISFFEDHYVPHGGWSPQHGLLILEFVAFISGLHLAARRLPLGGPPASIWRPAGFHLMDSGWRRHRLNVCDIANVST